ncbi:MAG: hypothetical protein U0263_42065 [Polyangiaceae bacterium]
MINRKDFGIVYPGMTDDLIKDDVAIMPTLAANKNVSDPGRRGSRREGRRPEPTDRIVGAELSRRA